MSRPINTRLRYVFAKDPGTIELFLSSLGFRVQIYDIIFAKGKFYLFFVPPDTSDSDVRSGDLDS